MINKNISTSLNKGADFHHQATKKKAHSKTVSEHLASKSLTFHISRGKLKLCLMGGKATQPTWKAAHRIPVTSVRAAPAYVLV